MVVVQTHTYATWKIITSISHLQIDFKSMDSPLTGANIWLRRYKREKLHRTTNFSNNKVLSLNQQHRRNMAIILRIPSASTKFEKSTGRVRLIDISNVVHDYSISFTAKDLLHNWTSIINIIRTSVIITYNLYLVNSLILLVSNIPYEMTKIS